MKKGWQNKENKRKEGIKEKIIRNMENDGGMQENRKKRWRNKENKRKNGIKEK